jgi:hypothetical protein
MPLIRCCVLSAAISLAALIGSASAEPIRVKVGILNDMSGVYADTGGKGSVVAAQMAVEDFARTNPDVQVEVVSADHQNKPDVGAAVARQWYDREGVDAILDVPTSSVALAVSQVTREKNRIFIDSGAGTTELTGRQCSPNTIQWTYDTYALAHGTAGAMLKRGGDAWYFLTADYAFGLSLQNEATAVIDKGGGRVLGAARVPFPATDFSSFLLQAQASGAKVVGLANAGGDTVNAVKQAHEFGLTESGQRLAALLIYAVDVHAIGLLDRAGAGAHRVVLLGPQSRDAGLLRAVLPAQRQQHADDEPCRRLCRAAALPEGGGGDEVHGPAGDHGLDEGQPDGRSAVRTGHGPGGRAQGAPDVPVRGEGARRVEGPVGSLPAPRHDPGRAGLPPPGRGGLPARRQAVGRGTPPCCVTSEDRSPG